MTEEGPGTSHSMSQNVPIPKFEVMHASNKCNRSNDFTKENYWGSVPESASSVFDKDELPLPI